MIMMSSNYEITNASSPAVDTGKVISGVSDAYTAYGPDMGWREYVRGDLKVIMVEGDHATIFKKPNVLDLAAKLKEVLKEYN